MLHVGFSIDEPGQGLPPFEGLGFVQDLDLVLVPPPHVTIQDDQAPNPLQLPFTDLIVSILIKAFNIGVYFFYVVLELESFYKSTWCKG